MPLFTIVMSDTVTYEREFTIEKAFRSRKAAEAWAEAHIDDTEAYPDPWETQIDNTPWEIEVERIKARPKAGRTKA